MASEKNVDEAAEIKGGILVPVDFSDSAEAALLLACDMAACMEAPLSILHVVHDPGDAPGYYHLDSRETELRRMEDVAKDMLDEFVSRVRTAHPELSALKSAQTLLVVGLPVTRILEVVEKVQARMVVMGSAGRTGLSHLMLGSKAEQIVRLCPTPVTIVKVPRGND